MKIEVIIGLILMVLLMTSCNNASTTFAWKCVIQNPTIETKGNVDFRPVEHDNNVKPETQITTDVTPEGKDAIVKELIQ